MTIYFVSRHPGAKEWARTKGLSVDQQLPHLDVAAIGPGDQVIGTLPVNLAAQVCDRGGRYIHLALDVVVEMRGRDLSADEMTACGARLEEYRVERVAPSS